MYGCLSSGVNSFHFCPSNLTSSDLGVEGGSVALSSLRPSELQYVNAFRGLFGPSCTNVGGRRYATLLHVFAGLNAAWSPEGRLRLPISSFCPIRVHVPRPLSISTPCPRIHSPHQLFGVPPRNPRGIRCPNHVARPDLR